MTPTRSGSNYSIQSNGSGPGHSSHKSKGQDCQPGGESQIEDARASTSSQRLAINFYTLIESGEAEITAIPVVRPEPFPTGKNRNIPVSIQELVYGGNAAGVGTSAKSLDMHNELISSSEEVHGPRKARLKNQSMLSENQKKKLAKKKVKSPVEAAKSPQEKIHLNKCQIRQANPKEHSEGQEKGKRKAKAQVEQAYPQSYIITKKEKKAMENVFNMARTLMELKKRRRKE
ncbi:hypothetical protein O181_117800 [Austropuccinia psidii MF-1]|uniref:Uncharacterized protein n=1 Tax=Austropuccinia psidii MF-1 TaxID=1389203 RepID=A0A9Q3KB17_9BASI|nr:hypothetical protein [Austropuccinia psidii MF-1]